MAPPRRQKKTPHDRIVGAMEVAVPPNFAAPHGARLMEWIGWDPLAPLRGLRPRLPSSALFGWRLGGDLRRSGWRRALTVPGSLLRSARLLVPVVAFEDR